MKRLPAIKQMSYISKKYTLNELKGLLKLTEKEINEWVKFYSKILIRINRLEVKHANKKRKLDVGVFKG